jgi:DNA-directed RNA polymerases I, II, and III subunit RPABC3
MSDPSLFEDTFTVSSIISGKYDRVHRIVGTASSGDTSLSLDINIELFPISMGDSVHMLIASTLAPDGTKDEGKGWRDVTQGEQTLADHYEYVCHGKVYRFEEGDGGSM